ncbi:GntR family transcriptional regulator [Phytoactinopolyspora endophytica]|uniref:GntR family transcriptional regulator n=1 Tax=Phytoactinopolyspora endophytica TaxID=1642495 RepID=UPI00101CA199|nr:GntR family transcriptional regulator [Phytoactinopolyspora endophytica]
MINNARVGPFDPNRGEPDFVYRKLAEHLATMIQTGDLASGEHLSEADLALEYQVSIPTVRLAVAELTTFHLVEDMRVVDGPGVSTATADAGDAGSYPLTGAHIYADLQPPDRWEVVYANDGTVQIVNPNGDVVASTRPLDGESPIDAAIRLGAQPVGPQCHDNRGIYSRAQPAWDSVMVAGLGVAANPLTSAVSLIIIDRVVEFDTEAARDLADAINEQADIADDIPTQPGYHDQERDMP